MILSVRLTRCSVVTCLLPRGGSPSTGLSATGLSGSVSALGLLGTIRGGVATKPGAEAGVGVLCAGAGAGEVCVRGGGVRELQPAVGDAFHAAISAGVMSSRSGSLDDQG